MQTRTFLGIAIGIGFALSCPAQTAEPVDPAALGAIDAMLATCRELNPGGKAQYDMMREAMIGEQSASALAALAQTAEYQRAFEESRTKAAAEPRDSARQGCAQLAAALGPRAPHADKSKKSK